MAETEETRIKKEIVAYLDSFAPALFHFAYHNMGYGKKGIPDRIICYRGFFVGIEVKRFGKNPTVFQQDRINEIVAAGGVAVPVWSVDDVHKALVPIFIRGGVLPFSCVYCESQNNLVTGPHSHACDICGDKATYGWYTAPRCEQHRPR